jgi:hypothetical protein
MPINESSRKPRRARWPLAFDLQGVPQSADVRKRLLEQIRTPTPTPHEDSMNSFAVDKLDDILTPEQKESLLNHLLATTPTGREIDLNKPPILRIAYKEYPRVIYHHKTGRVLSVSTPEQMKAAAKKGFKTEPAPDRDYSNVKNGIAQMKQEGPPREVELTAEEIALLDEEDSKAS